MSGPTHLLRIYFTQYVCVCLSVPTCLCRFCGNFIILSWNTCSCLTPPFLLLLFLVPLFDSTNMFSRSHYTFSLSISSCQTSLSATFLFSFSAPFFPVGLFLSLSFSVSYVYIFSQTYLRFLTNTHALLSRPLRLLPFSIFECSVIIIILTCV